MECLEWSVPQPGSITAASIRVICAQSPSCVKTSSCTNLRSSGGWEVSGRLRWLEFVIWRSRKQTAPEHCWLPCSAGILAFPFYDPLWIILTVLHLPISQMSQARFFSSQGHILIPWSSAPPQKSVFLLPIMIPQEHRGIGTLRRKQLVHWK